MNRALIFVLGMLTGVAVTFGYQHLRPSEADNGRNARVTTAPPQRTASPRNRQAAVARCFLEHNPQGYHPTSELGQGILAMCEAANP